MSELTEDEISRVTVMTSLYACAQFMRVAALSAYAGKDEPWSREAGCLPWATDRLDEIILEVSRKHPDAVAPIVGQKVALISQAVAAWVDELVKQNVLVGKESQD